MHVSNNILQPYFARIYLFIFFFNEALLALQAKWAKRKNPAVFCIFPFQSQKSRLLLADFHPHAAQPLTGMRRIIGCSSACNYLEEDSHYLPNYCWCCVYNFRGSHPLQSETIPHYRAAVWWKKLSLKSHSMWERDVQRASAGRRMLTVCAHVWVEGARKGDICAANVAQV